MKLYINGWEADLVEKALKLIAAQGGTDGDHAKKLLERMNTCKEKQKPHNLKKPT